MKSVRTAAISKRCSGRTPCRRWRWPRRRTEWRRGCIPAPGGTRRIWTASRVDPHEIRRISVPGGRRSRRVFRAAHRLQRARAHQPWIPVPGVVIGTRQGHPYCRMSSPARARWRRCERGSRWRGAGGEMRSNVLGACRLVAARPARCEGDGLAEEGRCRLREGDVSHAAATVQESWRRTAQLFGGRRFFLSTEDLMAERCRAGIREACLRSSSIHGRSRIGRPADAEPPDRPVIIVPAGACHLWELGRIVSPGRPRGPVRGKALQCLLDVQRRGPQAFEAAFGVPWTRGRLSWVADNTGLDPPGPSLPLADGWGASSLLALCAIVGGAWSRRRQVA